MQTALDIRPDYGQARFAMALAQIQSGDFANGWRTYEARWQSIDHETPGRVYPMPLWDGERLESGRLLLWGEQGVGDEIMFAGLLQEVIQTGNAITLECDARLRPLFARSFPLIEVVSRPNSEPVQAQEGVFTAHLPAGSMPGLFRMSESGFSNTAPPYLKPDLDARDRFRRQYFDGRRLVGLAWQTKNKRTGRRRSIALAALAPLFAVHGIRWISLQYGVPDELEQQVESAQAPILIDRAVDQFADIDLFAAQVAAMDRVLTIDNSTAHLAGALGLPVWLMLPFAADWRWLTDRQDSPWYPTMRLFRQAGPGDGAPGDGAPGDWAPVVQAVGAALASSA
jgi:hypothetical protein